MESEIRPPIASEQQLQSCVVKASQQAALSVSSGVTFLYREALSITVKHRILRLFRAGFLDCNFLNI